ncbi:alcohol dehydrogenase catalytic domain-containing protein [Cellulosimicrobium cellulans]|uniref:alcohol dehydrogenase catalytic domain-containing protein n=1 Tax=Cellulosimicrobium cellulans TaxID=1710 RepID=UPI002406620F|nr:zinc-binding dehydrogenase [Cellulosimicrobium cellulans]MDF9875843.1 NADPH2:quinone reductase [Cellulosimicrobium cellulans]
MDAIRLHAFGPPENLVLDQVPDPVPGPGQVLVAVRAHGVHLLDTTLRRGEATGGPLPLPTLPTIPGREVAGVVDAVGPGVDAAWRGRRVAAHLGATPDGGGYARLAVVAVEALHRIPDHVTAPDAIAMIGTGRTAVGILDLAELDATDTAIVTAAAGGLGTLIVQSALATGARVVALAGGPEKVALVRALATQAHADRLVAIDYRADGWLDEARTAVVRHAPAGATVLLDGVGGDAGTEAAALVAPDGRLVLFGWSSGEPNRAGDVDHDAGNSEAAAATHDVRWAVGPRARPWGDLFDLQERALALAADGTWHVVTHQVPLADAARAHRELEARATTGKVVLV